MINLVAPQPVSNYDFSKTLGRVLKKPMFLKIPSIVLKTILGEMSLLLLNSSNIYPKILLDSDYKFEFDNLTNLGFCVVPDVESNNKFFLFIFLCFL